MRHMIVLASAIVLAGTAAHAQQQPAAPGAKAAPAPASCKLQAGDKKLAGAALQSFMKKCGSDAEATCTKSADDKKLAGAARSSYTKKCVTDATGS